MAERHSIGALEIFPKYLKIILNHVLWSRSEIYIIIYTYNIYIYNNNIIQ